MKVNAKRILFVEYIFVVIDNRGKFEPSIILPLLLKPLHILLKWYFKLYKMSNNAVKSIKAPKGHSPTSSTLVLGKIKV